ncbi:MAG: mechanosensitive ion channel family protein [Deltaproteobacteria bacterium]|nr:mechanosensitive ion channel family protein [Deltaproteobacteria bacterium]
MINYFFENWIYFLLGAATLSLVIAGVLLMIRRAESTHRSRVKRTETSIPIEAVSLHGDQAQNVKNKALKSIRVRYTVIRHMALATVLLFVLLGAAFPLLGTVPATMLSALLAMFGIIIGIVAKPVLENLVAGLMLTLSRVVNVADTVLINDQYGTIEDITATHMVIKLWDWRRYVVPNARVLSTDFLNLSLFDAFQWAKVDFWVTPQADLAEVEKEVLQVARTGNKIANNEAPHFWVNDLQKDAVHCWVTAWAANPADAWELKHDLRMKISRCLQDRNICAHQHHLTLSNASSDR